ncbi:MAG: HU family DNA-binding protein [Candidatus Marinimicrobia bacterium]|nr:HU family DNA-binding protein [Candidatus Neomarinimicrobiota bacterium]
MNKQDVVAAVARRSGISKASADDAVGAVFGAITDALRKGEDVRLVGFGTFSTRRRAARPGRNPRTGETIQIPASTQPKFKPGRPLKDAVNG